jgi:hypothetical protein
MNTAPWDAGAAEGGHFEGWPAWVDHVRALLELAATRPEPLFCLDQDFSHWPLGEAGCVAALSQWVQGHPRAQCTMMASDWSRVAAQHPRWVSWRAPWGHRVLCRSPQPDEGGCTQEIHALIVLRGVLGLQVLDSERCIAVWSRKPQVLSRWWQQGDVILQRSQDAMPITTLGL